MARATVILREKVIDEAGHIVELVMRYRLAFIRCGETSPAVLYDNHHPKGHHRHIEGGEEPYAFVDVDRLLADFTADVRRLLGERTWPKR